jgi:hypothetical protein
MLLRLVVRRVQELLVRGFCWDLFASSISPRRQRGPPGDARA